MGHRARRPEQRQDFGKGSSEGGCYSFGSGGDSGDARVGRGPPEGHA